MNQNRLTVVLNKPAAVVFEYVTNPKNTPAWFESIVKEIAEFPPKIGTKYTNFNMAGDKGEYIVTQYQPNVLFQLDSLDSDYKVRYTLTPHNESETQLEYFEWVDSGILKEPCSASVLEKLAKILR